ncbi:hypothetical protein ACGFZS_17810 [Streptomyces sp. NPDC048288]|uniref:hypothetical protein n=1 Tax=Streptomyces sp. NPDC048288 TaxID=3365529 RepID=UPI003718B21F
MAEARRVLGRGGRIVPAGQDWDALMIDSDDAELTRTIVRARADLLGSPRAARRYRNLPPATRLAEQARANGAVGRDRADEWLAGQRGRAEADRFLVAVPFFVAASCA